MLDSLLTKAQRFPVEERPDMGIFKRLRSSRIGADRRGAAVAEYGLIAAVAGVAIAVASLALG